MNPFTAGAATGVAASGVGFIGIAFAAVFSHFFRNWFSQNQQQTSRKSQEQNNR